MVRGMLVRLSGVALLALALTCIAIPAQAQEWPTKPVRIVPGDVVAADQLSSAERR